MRRPARETFAGRALLFGGATAINHGSQVVWLAAGSRVMAAGQFGGVLAAQALYGLLQVGIDNGAAFHGARRSAQSELSPELRASLTRARLQLCLPAIAVGVVYAAVADQLATTVPFLVALPLFAVLNTWEAYGRGDALPWTAYLSLRSLVPALAAVTVLVAGTRFPGALPGLLECASILVCASVFRTQMFSLARSALRAERGPWREVLQIGLPSLATQISLAAGTVLLAGSRAASIAAELAISVRLLTGLQSANGVVVAALFPGLAANARNPREGENVAVGVVLRSMLAISVIATAVALLATPLLVRLLLGRHSVPAEAALGISLASSGAMAAAMMINSVMVARHHEAPVLPRAFTGMAITLGLGLAVLALAPHLQAPSMAAALAAGQMTSAALLAWWVARHMPALGRTALAAAAGAGLLIAVALAAALEPSARIPLGVPLAILGTAELLRQVGRGRRHLRGTVRR